jgi:glycosyltransferase involved in cell wall biosynthesis
VRILFHSNSPWSPSGYGQQTAIWVPRIAAMGHEVAISAFHGHEGGPTEWQGHPVFARGVHPYGGDIVGMHAKAWKADLVILLMDVWALPMGTLEDFKVAAWMPVDTDPLGKLDDDTMKSKKGRPIIPIALTRFGQANLIESGWKETLYVPHGIDTELFRPPLDRKELRKAHGVDDHFVIVMNAANMDEHRKGYPEQFAAFARLHARHRDTLMMVHAAEVAPWGINLRELAASLGIEDAVRFVSQYDYVAGTVEPQMIAATLGAGDLFSNCAYAEGFGLTPLEAMSCGVPTVVTEGSAMSEVCEPAWRVGFEPQYKHKQRAWWHKPRIDDIERVYLQAYTRGPAYHDKKKLMREWALRYDVDVVTEHWRKALKILEAL